MAGGSHRTTNHEEIRKWVEERGGYPATVTATSGDHHAGLLRIDFPGYTGEGRLERIPWDEFFEKFDEKNLVFLYQDTTRDGEMSRFSKFVAGKPGEPREKGDGASRRSRKETRGAEREEKGARAERPRPKARKEPAGKRREPARKKQPVASSREKERARPARGERTEDRGRKDMEVRAERAAAPRMRSEQRPARGDGKTRELKQERPKMRKEPRREEVEVHEEVVTEPEMIRVPVEREEVVVVEEPMADEGAGQMREKQATRKQPADKRKGQSPGRKVSRKSGLPEDAHKGEDEVEEFLNKL